MAVDARAKGITGDLFGPPSESTPAAGTGPARATESKSPPAAPPKSPRSTTPAKPGSAIALKPPLLVEPRTTIRENPGTAISAQPSPTASRGALNGSPRTTPAARSPRPAALTRKLPAWYHRLPLGAQRCYLASDAIDRIPLTPSPAAFASVTALMTALEGGAPTIVQRASQALLNEVCRLLRVRPVPIEVRSVRPRNSRGELHGLFYPQAPSRVIAADTRPRAAPTAGEPLIVLWMRTAQRHNVVKPRTYLRTLFHELGHYLDYALLKLGDSYHTIGFYQRESFLLRTLSPADSPPPRSK